MFAFRPLPCFFWGRIACPERVLNRAVRAESSSLFSNSWSIDLLCARTALFSAIRLARVVRLDWVWEPTVKQASVLSVKFLPQFPKGNRSRGWNGVPSESMKRQPRILRRYAPQEDSFVVVARGYFQGRSFDFGRRGDLRSRMTAVFMMRTLEKGHQRPGLEAQADSKKSCNPARCAWATIAD